MTTNDPRPIFDPVVLDRHTGGDRELLLDVVSMFVEDCPVRVAAIRAAVESADATRLQASAHTLKGSAAYLSASFVVDAAADLELIGSEGRVVEAMAALQRLDTAVAQLIPALRLFTDNPPA